MKHETKSSGKRKIWWFSIFVFASNEMEKVLSEMGTEKGQLNEMSFTIYTYKKSHFKLTRSTEGSLNSSSNLSN